MTSAFAGDAVADAGIEVTLFALGGDLIVKLSELAKDGPSVGRESPTEPVLQPQESPILRRVRQPASNYEVDGVPVVGMMS